MASSAPSPPSISAIRAQSSTLNLLPLQRIDAQIQAVVLTAKHTVLYTLDQHTETWEREEVEGPFFLVERSSPPYYAMAILNRRSIDNFLQEIAPDMTFEIQDNYLFFQVRDDVIGVWFYEQPEVVQATAALNKIVKNLQNPSFRPPTPLPPPPPPPSAPSPSPLPKSKQSTPKLTPPPTSSTPSQRPRKPPPPIIHTQQGKRMHRKAPPPPTLELHVGLDGGDARVLERRLGEFMAAFDREDEQHRKAHEEEVKRVELSKANLGQKGDGGPEGEGGGGGVGAEGVPLTLDVLFRAAQGGGQLPPMPGAVSNGVKGITSAEELERRLRVGKEEQGEVGEDSAPPPLHPLLSQMFGQSMRPPSPPPSQLLSPASLFAATAGQSMSSPRPLPAVPTSLYHLSVPIPSGLSFDAFRGRVQSLLNDQHHLTRWYAEYCSTSPHPSPP